MALGTYTQADNTRRVTRAQVAALILCLALPLAYEACGRNPQKDSATRHIGSAGDGALLQRYVAACESALGSESAQVTVPPIDCSDPDMVSIDTMPEDSNGQKSPIPRCHAPSALLGGYAFDADFDDNLCAPGSKISRRDQGAVTWITVCRKYQHHKDPNVFDDVNMIGYNRETGKTCFFNSHVTGDTIAKPLRFTGAVSVYDDHATKYFMSPDQIQNKVPCADCHAANPFLRSPHVKASGAFELPSLTKNTPYDIVWPEYFMPDQVARPNLRIDPSDVPAIKTCVGCHAVGAGRYCEVYVPLAWGQLNADLTYAHFASGTVSQAPHSLWHRDVIPKLRTIQGDEDLGRAPQAATIRALVEACKDRPVTIPAHKKISEGALK